MNTRLRKLPAMLLALSGASLFATTASAQDSCDQQQVVGSWRGVSGEGNGLVTSFFADGVVVSSVQGEVTINPRLSTLTPTHGGWTYVGNCRYEYSVTGLLYNIQTGRYTGHARIKGRVSMDPSDPDLMTGNDKVSIYDAAGNLLLELPEGEARFSRLAVESYD